MVLGSCLLFAGCGSDDTGSSSSTDGSDVPQFGDGDKEARPGGDANQDAAELAEAEE